MPVDREARRELVCYIDEFLKGSIGDTEFSDKLDVYSEKESDDLAVVEVSLALCAAYEDYFRRNRKLFTLTPIPDGEEAYGVLECCKLFLRSELEYEWEPSDLFSTISRMRRAWKSRLMRIFRRQSTKYCDERSLGDQSVWPFFRNSDYDESVEVRGETQCM